MLIRTQFKKSSTVLPNRVEVTVAGKIHVVPVNMGDFNVFLSALAEVLAAQDLAVTGFPELKRKSGNTRHWEVRVTPLP